MVDGAGGAGGTDGADGADARSLSSQQAPRGILPAPRPMATLRAHSVASARDYVAGSLDVSSISATAVAPYVGAPPAACSFSCKRGVYWAFARMISAI